MKYLKVIAFVTVCILAYFPLFHQLGEWPIQIFDESRTALNSLSMSLNGNYIVTYVNNQPDMWNTKPPLFFWVQSTSIQLFGFNAFALRIPSAIFGLLTCILLFWFSSKYLKNSWLGLLSVMVLVTFQGYIRAHVTRTGDFDSMLVFFTTIQVLFYWLYLQKDKSKYLIVFFVALILAGLTKGIAALFFTPIFFLFLFVEKRFKSTIRNPYTWIGIALFLFFVIGYYVLRDHMNEGYIKAAFANDMGGRFNVPQEGNKGNLFYYCNTAELLYWMYFLLPTFLMPFFIKDKSTKRLMLYLGALCVFYFVLISWAQTKLPWYLAQLYPLLALMIAMFLYRSLELLNKRLQFSNPKYNSVVIALILVAVFAYPYIITFQKVVQGADSERNNPRYALSYFIKDNVLEGDLNLDNYIYLNDRYNPHVDYQLASLNYSGANITFGQKNSLFEGDKVILWQADVLAYINKHYSYDELMQENGVYLLEIKKVVSLSD